MHSLPTPTTCRLTSPTQAIILNLRGELYLEITTSPPSSVLIACRIVDISGTIRTRYKLACSYGILYGMFLAGDLFPNHGAVVIPEEVAGQPISLCEAAKKSAAATQFVRNKCNCLTG